VADAEAPGNPLAYELAYTEAVRALAVQDAGLDGVRNRAGIVISAAAIVAGFLGPPTLRADAWGYVAAILFVAACLGAIFVLQPVKDWRSTTNASDLISAYIESDPPATMAEIHRSLAIYMQADWARNEARLVTLNNFLAISAGAMIGATTFALVALATT
jgi:hypothetical protein